MFILHLVGLMQAFISFLCYKKSLSSIMLFMDALIIGFDLSVIIGFSERLRGRLMRFNASFWFW